MTQNKVMAIWINTFLNTYLVRLSILEHFRSPSNEFATSKITPKHGAQAPH